jgi:hypothetical protein
VAANKAGVAVAFTGTNLGAVKAIALGPDTACANLAATVTGTGTAMTVTVTTPAGGCDATVVTDTYKSETIKFKGIALASGATVTKTLSGVVLVDEVAVSTDKFYHLNGKAIDSTKRVTAVSTAGKETLQIDAAAGIKFYNGMTVTTVDSDPTKVKKFVVKIVPAVVGGVNQKYGTTATLTTPAGLPAGPLTVAITNQGLTTNLVTGLTVKAVPSVAKLSKNSGAYAGGYDVVITGKGFDATTLTNNTVKFGGVSATVKAATETSLTVTVPVQSALSPVTVVPVTVTVATVASPVTGGSVFTYLWQ